MEKGKSFLYIGTYKEEGKEKYGRVFALRRAGWDYQQISEDMQSRWSAEELKKSFLEYAKSHPKDVARWVKQTRR